MVFTSPVRENYDLISQHSSVKLMYVENPVFSSCLGLQILLVDLFYIGIYAKSTITF